MSATLSDMNVRVFGDAAVVTGTDEEVTVEDQEIQQALRLVSVVMASGSLSPPKLR